MNHTIEPARRDELEAAFRLLFDDLTPEERERRVRGSLALVQDGELDPAGVFVARDQSGPTGALVCQPTAGAGSLLWPPRVVECATREAIEDGLMRRACSWLQDAGARMTHALLTEEERPRGTALLRNGFQRITSLWYLAHDLGGLPDSTARMNYQTYDACDPVAFRETLLRTYEHTLDCPEVNDVRSVEDILEGHKSQGNFDARRWWLAHQENVPVGVLLLADVPALGGWDVSYLGVVPEARRRGLGRDLTVKAMHEARQAGAPRLTLAVDERNKPAWELYRGLGFSPFDQRQVFLAIWPAALGERPA